MSPGEATMDTAATIEFLRTLRTVRRFTDQPVPESVLDDLLAVLHEVSDLAVSRLP